MEISEQVIKYAAIMILIIVGIVIFIYFYDQLTGSNLIKSLVAGILYVIPLGSVLNVLTQGLNTIPA